MFKPSDKAPGVGQLLAELFMEAGVPVYDADAAVHQLYEGEAAPAIEAAFPGTTSGGTVDRAEVDSRPQPRPALSAVATQVICPIDDPAHQLVGQLIVRGPSPTQALWLGGPTLGHVLTGRRCIFHDRELHRKFYSP